MDVLLEYNTSNEAAKSGFLTKEELFECIEASLSMIFVRIRGLMTDLVQSGDQIEFREGDEEEE